MTGLGVALGLAPTTQHHVRIYIYIYIYSVASGNCVPRPLVLTTPSMREPCAKFGATWTGAQHDQNDIKFTSKCFQNDSKKIPKRFQNDDKISGKKIHCQPNILEFTILNLNYHDI